ncbi:hypothetical protein C6503_19090 [Candidatus Poribacteria bacterium]|nr:MAG: hypothetical protein C6503_19090 [Candidatus Poribacteria bacterium]
MDAMHELTSAFHELDKKIDVSFAKLEKDHEFVRELILSNKKETADLEKKVETQEQQIIALEKQMIEDHAVQNTKIRNRTIAFAGVGLLIAIAEAAAIWLAFFK